MPGTGASGDRAGSGALSAGRAAIQVEDAVGVARSHLPALQIVDLRGIEKPRGQFGFLERIDNRKKSPSPHVVR
jgi:hypothetical protein